MFLPNFEIKLLNDGKGFLDSFVFRRVLFDIQRTIGAGKSIA